MSSIRERNKELILRAASEEFADKGFAATKTSDIAAKAGLPKPNVYYYFKSKENLYREVLESIIEPIMRASTPFNRDGVPAQVLSAYIRSKIHISRDLPFASKVFASEIMHGAPHLTADQVAQLNGQAKHNIDCIQAWIDSGQIAPVDPHHLMFTIWAATQTYADFDWQISTVTGKARLEDADYEAATQTIIRLVLKGCEPDRPLPVAQ
jgi:TetR/AcrR family transcriptional regulator